MANVINATSTGSGGLITSGDDSGVLNIQTNETTAVTVDTSQNVGVGVTPSTTNIGGTFSLLAVGKTGGSGIFMGQTDVTATNSTAAQFLGKTTGTAGYQLVGGMIVATDGSSTANAVGRLQFYTATGGTLNEAMRINSSGYVTTPYQPAFLVGWTSGGNLSLADNTLIPFDNDSTGNCFDTGNNWNTSTSRFTAPVAGTYQFQTTVCTATSGTYSVQLKKNGTAINNGVDTCAGFIYGAGTTGTMITTVLVSLAVGDYIEAFTRNGAYSVYKNHSWFIGRLLG